MWYNAIMKGLLRSPLHPIISKQFMLITVTGRKTERQYTVPVNYVRSGSTLWVMSQPDRTWWRNLRAGQPVGIRLQGQDLPATGTAIEGSKAVAEALTELLRLAPQYARHLAIPWDATTNQPAAGPLQQAAAQRVMIRVDLD